MSYDSLKSLYETFPAKDKKDLVPLGLTYQKRQQQEILEIAAIAADVSLDSLLNLGLETEVTPLLREAFSRQYPNVDINSLVGASAEQLQGWQNAIKGKYFELLVKDRLNSGESVGELSLAPGQVARLAESPTQTGFDLEIVNSEEDSIVEVLQLKATSSLSYVKEALEKNPDIRVATTSDIDSVSENILQTDISNEYLKEIVNPQVGELGENLITDVLHQSAEWAFDSLPLVPGVIILVTEGHSVLAGRSSFEESLERSARKLGKAGAFSIIGATMTALGLGMISIPVTVATRIASRRVENRIAMGEFLESKSEELRQLKTSSL